MPAMTIKGWNQGNVLLMPLVINKRWCGGSIWKKSQFEGTQIFKKWIIFKILANYKMKITIFITSSLTHFNFY